MSTNIAVVSQEGIPGSPDPLDVIVQQGLAVDPEVRSIGDNHLTAEQDLRFRRQLRDFAIEISQAQLANIARQRTALDEAEEAIEARLAMAEASGNGHAYPADLSQDPRRLIASQELTDRESAICQLIPQDGITVRRLGKLLADNELFTSSLAARRKSIEAHLAELEERGIVTSLQSGRWTKFYKPGDVPKESSGQSEAPAQPSKSQSSARASNGSSVPNFRPGSASGAVYAYVAKVPVRGRSLDDLESADLNLGNKNARAIADSLVARKLLVNRGERGAPHYYLVESDPGEKPVSQSASGKGQASVSRASKEAPSPESKVGQVYALVPGEGRTITSTLISNQLYKDSRFNDKAYDRIKVGTDVSQLLRRLEKSGLISKYGKRGSYQYTRNDGSLIQNPEGDFHDGQARLQGPISDRHKSAPLDTEENPVTDIDPRKLPKPPIGVPKRKPQDEEHFDTILGFLVEQFGPRFRLSQVGRYYVQILRSCGFHEYGSTSTTVHNGLVKAVGRSSLVIVDSADHDIIEVSGRGGRSKTNRGRCPKVVDDDDDDSSGSPEPVGASSKPVAENDADIDDMIMSIFHSASRDFSVDDLVEEVFKGHGEFILKPGTTEQKAESIILDALLRLTYDLDKLEANDDETWSLPR